jgi:hypothetical protein
MTDKPKAAENNNNDADNQMQLDAERRVDAMMHPDKDDAGSKSPDTIESANAEEDDPITDKAVDDIVFHESDELLKHEDDELSQAFAPAGKAGIKEKLRNFFSGWVHNPRTRRLTLAGLLVFVVLLAVIPPSRYFFLNAAGVRAAASLVVLDDSTQQPLKNVYVTLGGQTVQTDGDGRMRMERLKLGRQRFIVQKRAFAEINQKITVGWGSNPLGERKLTPVGVQYSFIAVDFLSGKPIESAEATSGEASAVADDQGKIVLTVDKDAPEDDNIVIVGDQYRQEILTPPANSDRVQTVRLVPARPLFFVSNRSGRFDVYRIDADGKNEKIIFPGTGSERSDITLLPHPSEPIVAVVSTRDDKRNKDGYLLSTLTTINASDSKPVIKEVTQSEQVQLLGWFNERLAYVQVAAGASGNNPRRYLLLSYAHDSGDRKELAASNYFNGVLAAHGMIYYAPSVAYQPGREPGLFRVSADGGEAERLLNVPVWSIFRGNYEMLDISSERDWYSLRLGESSAKKTKGQPANLHNRQYISSPDGSRSLWVDIRDGKGVLLVHEPAKPQDDKSLHIQSGLDYPLQWLNDTTIIYRIQTDLEIADYALSLEGGEPIKIIDVSSSEDANRRYYR